MGKLCNELGSAYSWPTGETPRLSKVKKVIECIVENFVSMVAVTKRRAVAFIEFSKGEGNLERKQVVEDTMLNLSQPFTLGLEERDISSSAPTARVTFSMKLSNKNLLMRNFPVLSPMRERYSGIRYQK